MSALQLAVLKKKFKHICLTSISHNTHGTYIFILGGRDVDVILSNMVEETREPEETFDLGWVTTTLPHASTRILSRPLLAVYMPKWY